MKSPGPHSFSILIAVGCSAWLAVAYPAMAADASVAPPPVDWLINPAPYKAQIHEDKAKQELVLDNGLARRVIRLAPNAATISLGNYVSQTELIRALAPEARVTINGTEYAVGGLSGALNANYVDEAWRDRLTPIPGAYRFAGWREEPVRERFPWKKKREWMARDLPWPPPGRHIVMDYVPPAQPPAALSGPLVVEHDFLTAEAAKWGKGWTILKAPGLDRASFINEGKVGEVMAWNASAVCAETAWPKDAQSAEVVMNSGEDNSDAWAPGLCVIAGGQAFSFIMSPQARTYHAAGGSGGRFDPAKSARLRVRHFEGQLYFEAAQGDEPFALVNSVGCVKTPDLLRVGKPGMNGSGSDAGNDHSIIRLRVEKVSFRGQEPKTAPIARADLPRVEVHYELYDGIPLMQKWLVVENTSKAKLRVNRFVAEELRLAQPGFPVETNKPISIYSLQNIYVETDMTFHGSMQWYNSNPAVSITWEPDFSSHGNNETPCILRATPPIMGPDVDVSPGESFTSFRVFVLLPDSTESERCSMAHRRMYHTVAPWTAENPFMFHKLGSDPADVRNAIDQAAEAGFDLVIMSFGSGFNFETRDEKYIAAYRELADYGRNKGIALGGYSLLASRGAATPADNTQGSPATYGVMPCLGSRWGRNYLDTIRNFCDKAGLGAFENDGSYPGDRCAATNHPYHHGLEDSQWVMWKGITGLYQWCTGNGVYLNIPDWYFLSGATKCAMHYAEPMYGRPRDQQILIERQYMFDGTYFKTASMGWMFIPLSSYNGGAASTIEPLDQHREHYNERLADMVGYGVQACYRGPRLYDSDATKAIVKKWTSFYKSHREVLDGDIIHLRRPDGRNWDGIVHVNPQGKEKAMAFLYNPLAEDIEREIRIPLYYSGLTDKSQASIGGAPSHTILLDRTGTAAVRVRIPAMSQQWVLFTGE